GGGETQVHLVSQELARQGYRVALIVYDVPEGLPKRVGSVDIIIRAPYKSNKRLIGKVIEVITVWRALRGVPSRTVIKRIAGVDIGVICLFCRLTRRRFIFSSASIVDFEYEKLIPRYRGLAFYELGAKYANDIVVQTEEQVDLCRSRFGRTPVVIKSVAEPATRPASDDPEAFLWIARLVDYKRPLDYLELARSLPEA